jgi:hypothetical protein
MSGWRLDWTIAAEKPFHPDCGEIKKNIDAKCASMVRQLCKKTQNCAAQKIGDVAPRNNFSTGQISRRKYFFCRTKNSHRKLMLQATKTAKKSFVF